MFPDGRHVVSASEDKTLKVWNVAAGRCLATLEGHSKGVMCVAVFPCCAAMGCPLVWFLPLLRRRLLRLRKGRRAEPVELQRLCSASNRHHTRPGPSSRNQKLLVCLYTLATTSLQKKSG